MPPRIRNQTLINIKETQRENITFAVAFFFIRGENSHWAANSQHAVAALEDQHRFWGINAKIESGSKCSIEPT